MRDEMQGQISVAPAQPQDLDVVRELFLEYATWLGLDLSFQGFDAELASLPGKYGPPGGCLLIARRLDVLANQSGEVIGCVAMRLFDAKRCEMKRLWIRPEFRNLGAGRMLALAIIDAARGARYDEMVLDTLESMESAVGLYQSLGFVRIPAYYHNPIPGAVYFSLDL